MNTIIRRYALIRCLTPVLAALAVCGAATGSAPGVAAAQDAAAPPAAAPAPAAKAPAKSTPQIDAGEPRAETSPAPAAPAEQAQAPSPPPPPAKGAAAQSRPAKPAAAQKTDRLDLNTATVTGDREQPKVMYIVPWKSADMGDLSGKPMNSLLDEALAPVDRDEFRREVAYFGAVKADRPQNGAASPAAKQGEK